MNKNDIDLIKQAIILEIEGKEFYKLVATKANSIEVKNALLNLADEENLHIEWLYALFDRIEDDSLDDYTLASINIPSSPKIFIMDLIKDEPLEFVMSVFSIAMKMEQKSIEFYEKAKKESELNESRQLFEALVNWEQSHLEQFRDDYQNLHEEWWATQNFAPF